MLDAPMFDVLDSICRAAREQYDVEIDKLVTKAPHSKDLPFGGIQIIVTGDFCQLPPVTPFRFCNWCGGDELADWSERDGRPLSCSSCPRVYNDEDKWAFCATAWNQCKFAYMELKQIHRQSDVAFIELLQRCRRGMPFTEAERKLLMGPRDFETQRPVELLPTKAQIRWVNQREFNKLPGPPFTFECLDFHEWRRADHPELEHRFKPKYVGRQHGPLKSLNEHRLEESVQYKVGTVVLLLVNLNIKQGLVNGTQGEIIRFQSWDDGPTHNDIPEQFGEDADLKSAKVRMFMENSKARCWPVVRFNNGITRTICATCQVAELGPRPPYSLIGRTQIPLLPAWAITVHKSQGMTLSRVVVDLAKAFEREMVYVALSRAKGLDGLKVNSLPEQFGDGMNAQVERFYAEKFGRAAVA